MCLVKLKIKKEGFHYGDVIISIKMDTVFSPRLV